MSRFKRVAAAAVLGASLAAALAPAALASPGLEQENCASLKGIARSRCLVQKESANAGFGAESDPVVIVGNIINAVLGILGVIFLGLVVYGGYLWMTARGDAEQVTKAKDTIERAAIGLVIMLAAYAISNFVVDKLVGVTGSGAVEEL